MEKRLIWEAIDGCRQKKKSGMESKRGLLHDKEEQGRGIKVTGGEGTGKSGSSVSWISRHRRVRFGESEKKLVWVENQISVFLFLFLCLVVENFFGTGYEVFTDMLAGCLAV